MISISSHSIDQITHANIILIHLSLIYLLHVSDAGPCMPCDGEIVCTFAKPQLLCKLPIGCKAVRLHIRNKQEFLQCGRALQLLPARGYCGVQTTDLDSTSSDAVKVMAYEDINRCRNQTESNTELKGTKRCERTAAGVLHIKQSHHVDMTATNRCAKVTIRRSHCC